MRDFRRNPYKIAGWLLFVLTFGVLVLYLILPTDPEALRFGASQVGTESIIEGHRPLAGTLSYQRTDQDPSKGFLSHPPMRSSVGSDGMD